MLACCFFAQVTAYIKDADGFEWCGMCGKVPRIVHDVLNMHTGIQTCGTSCVNVQHLSSRKIPRDVVDRDCKSSAITSAVA